MLRLSLLAILTLYLGASRPAVGQQQSRGRILKGHTAEVMCAAFAPDGRTLASLDRLGGVKLWDVATGTEKKSWDTQEGLTEKGLAGWVAFSPDGRRLAVGADTQLSVWDSATGKRELIFPKDANTRVAWSPDGKWLASASGDKVIRIWDVAKRVEEAALGFDSDDANCVAFSPTGKVLASGGESGVITLWEVGTWKALHALKGHGAVVTSLGFSKVGNLLASGGRGVVKLWDVPRAKAIRTLKVGDLTRAMALSGDGKRVATGYSEGLIKIWEVVTGKEVCALQGHSEFITSLVFSPDGRRLVSTSADKTVRMWEMSAPRVEESRLTLRLAVWC